MPNETIIALYGKSLSFACHMFLFWNDFKVRFPVVTTKQLNVMDIQLIVKLFKGVGVSSATNKT